MRGALRILSTRRRAVVPIAGVPRVIHTLHPPRRCVADGVRPPFTLDGLVAVTLARVRWIERRAV